MFFNYKAKVVLKATGKEFILKENNKPFLIRQFKNNTISLIIILSEAGFARSGRDTRSESRSVQNDEQFFKEFRTF